MSAPAIMVLGTASHVGKSTIATGLCRLLARAGLRAAPFKAQNLSNNSFVTLDGLEIGRSTATQAQAAGVEPTVDMNPVLLKPMGSQGCQLVLMGKPVGNLTMAQYNDRKPEVTRAVHAAYDRLAASHDAIVLEGAGGCAEINLRAFDLVNFAMADHADARVLLAGDIERGGVFAQIYGTIALLTEAERARVFGWVVNKFHGNREILDPGLAELERLTGKPMIGLLPWFKHNLDEEDSEGLERFDDRPKPAAVQVVALKLPGIANFTDLHALAAIPDVAVCVTDRPEHIGAADLLVIPGSKQTVADLEFLRRTGLAEAVIRHAQDGGFVVGLCGGWQMLGREILDEGGVESGRVRTPGLGLLNAVTEFEPTKRTVRVTGRTIAGGAMGAAPLAVVGYEIHMGRTRREPGCRPWLELTDVGSGDVHVEGGADPTGRVLGTYCHGLLDSPEFAAALINRVRSDLDLPPIRPDSVEPPAVARARGFDDLADRLLAAFDGSQMPEWIRRVVPQWRN